MVSKNLFPAIFLIFLLKNLQKIPSDQKLKSFSFFILLAIKLDVIAKLKAENIYISSLLILLFKISILSMILNLKLRDEVKFLLIYKIYIEVLKLLFYLKV